MTVLETPRLVLRRLLPDDLDALYAIYRDPEVRRYFPDGTLSYAQTREELDWFLDGHPDDSRMGLWAAILKETGEFIGRCGLLLWDIEGRRETEIAYLLARSHWRQGLGAEAARALVRYGFVDLRLPRLVALIDAGNAASIRTATAAGLAFERETEVDGVQARLFAISNPGAGASLDRARPGSTRSGT